MGLFSSEHTQNRFGTLKLIVARARPQPHAVVPHYKQSNTFPMSLENHQQIYGYTCVYSISVSGLVFAAFAVCHRCTQVLEKCIISIHKSHKTQKLEQINTVLPVALDRLVITRSVKKFPIPFITQ